MNESRSIAARMGRWSANHRKTAIFGWLAFVALSFYFGFFTVGLKELDPADAGAGESGRMTKILDREFEQPAAERVIVQSPTLTAGEPAFRQVVVDVVRRLQSVNEVTNIRSPLQDENFNLVSSDEHSALVDFQIAGDPDDAMDKVQPILG